VPRLSVKKFVMDVTLEVDRLASLLIVLTLIFRATEEIVTEQSWYQGGYRANVVAYAIAKMGSDCEKREEFVDFDAVWRAQGISENMGAAIASRRSEAQSRLWGQADQR